MKQYYGYLLSGILSWTLDYNTKEFKFHNFFFKNFYEYIKVFIMIEIVILILLFISSMSINLLQFYISLFITFVSFTPFVIYDLFSKRVIKKDAFKSIYKRKRNQLIKKKISDNILTISYKGCYLDYYFTRDFSSQLQLIKSYEENKKWYLQFLFKEIPKTGYMKLI